LVTDLADNFKLAHPINFPIGARIRDITYQVVSPVIATSVFKCPNFRGQKRSVMGTFEARR